MRRRVLLLGVIALVCVSGACSSGEESSDTGSLLGPPPGRYELSSAGGAARIPFELYRDDIMMAGEVNGKRARLMLDNGMMWDEVLLFGSARVDSMGLTYEDELALGGAGGGDTVQSRLASGVAVSFPGVSFADQVAIVTPESQRFAEMWEADGQVCGTFFKHFIVDIDFDNGVITLTPPDQFESPDEAVELPLSAVGSGAWAFPGTVVTSDGQEIAVPLTMDLGGVTALSVAILEGSPLPVPDDAVEAVLGYGIQGEIRGYKATFPALKIGDYVLEEVPAGFSEAAGNCSSDDSIIVGMPVFSRFNVTFDYPGGRIFLVPNARFSEPFAGDGAAASS